jgi:pimeloyl-ACP methyl ester carboxylesterase
MDEVSMAAKFQLVLFPGLGADARLFKAQQQAFPDLIVPPWIPPRLRSIRKGDASPKNAGQAMSSGESQNEAVSNGLRERDESLPEYAARLAATLNLRRDVPVILGGVSFGGMIAYEMARHVRPAAVIQIASCRLRRSLRPFYRFGRYVIPSLPMSTWSLAKLLASPAVGIASHFGARDRTLAVTMFREMDSAFMNWVLTAILDWNPTQYEGTPIFQIHGRRDLLLPVGRVNADVYIPDGGHMINVTHAQQVNAFISETAERVLA